MSLSDKAREHARDAGQNGTSPSSLRSVCKKLSETHNYNYDEFYVAAKHSYEYEGIEPLLKKYFR